MDGLTNLRDSFLDGRVLLIDKPLEWTSFDVVNKLKYRLKYDLDIPKIKIGHAGTLDPLATGLLIICTGKKTKTISSIQDQTKVYTGHIMLGATRPSFDKETEIDERYSTDHITPELLTDAAKSFLGEYEQNVPIYSAVKVDGVRSYKLARRGEEVRIKTRTVLIDDFTIDDTDFPSISFSVTCSKGTYIRALADDFGKRCDSGAYLDSLRRTKIGDYDVQDALTPEEWIKNLKENL